MNIMPLSVAAAALLLLCGCGTTGTVLDGTWRIYVPSIPSEPLVYQVGRITFAENGTTVYYPNVLDAPDLTKTNRYTVQGRKLVLHPDDPDRRVEYRISRKRDEVILNGQHDVMPIRLKREHNKPSHHTAEGRAEARLPASGER